MKRLITNFILLTALIGGNAMATTLLTIQHDTEDYKEQYQTQNQEEADRQLSDTLNNSLEFTGEWQAEESGTVTNRIKLSDGSIEYYKPTNFSVSYEDSRRLKS